ncbi:MAG: 4Fe-4S dicluster domain-containing protein [Candidatus Koribacter versatilis]|uniref:4Fe-4S dicluster domain-containing protein n=1 Tax=Candidatus Korobacter versatilis TaxID=658062 RepID=A0A932EQL7_9BACT|nr:4Fe-4S dicluster domain-containing protein [Candidatus Koribacter versatilis]
MDVSRRGFFGFLVRGAAALVAVGAVSKALASRIFREELPARSIAPSNQRWVMVIDLAKCDGCRDCTKACRAMHFVPPMQDWIKVFEITDNPTAGAYWLARPCMHCDNPPCVRGCPVGATFKRTDGIVMQDNDRCIGCRNCIAQCPYGARSFNWADPPHTAQEMARPYSMEYMYPHRKGTVEKCGFCPHHLREGKLPACASACTMGAVYFGDELEDAVTNSKGETIQFTKITKRGAAFRLMEELGTEPRVYYLPPANRKYPSPVEKQHA